jgi:hypothetical protein
MARPLRYVVLNPVRAGMVAEAGGWGWSSDRATAGIQDAPGWLDVAAALSLFDRNMATARTVSRRFVAEGIHQPCVTGSHHPDMTQWSPHR